MWIPGNDLKAGTELKLEGCLSKNNRVYTGLIKTLRHLTKILRPPLKSLRVYTKRQFYGVMIEYKTMS